MVPSHRVTNKCHCLSLHNLQKCLGIKPWQVTLVWFPSPIEKIHVHPPLHETILWFWDCCTAWIGIEEWPSWFSNPMTFRQVTALSFYKTNNIFLTQKQPPPRKKRWKNSWFCKEKQKRKGCFEIYSDGIGGLAWVMMLVVQGLVWIWDIKGLENRGGRCWK